MTDGETRTLHVDVLSRVEGEGRFTLRTERGAVVEAKLEIFEAPRFFEAFLRGRYPDDAVDIVARICGICPVAYQVSASRAFEDAFGVVLPDELSDLRRLLYCGEWIESHALHVFMLHAPDFLGYPSAIEMAKDHRAIVEMGLGLRRAGNAIIELLGGRATHPVSPRVGGFHRAPSTAELRALSDELARALDEAIDAARWAAALPTPAMVVDDYVFAALDDGDRYPIERGDAVRFSTGEVVPLDALEQVIVETQVPHSNALHARRVDGGSYLTGPMARLHHHAERLHPVAQRTMHEIGLGASERNPYRSIVIRAVEVVHAFAEALDLIDRYRAPSAPYVAHQRRAAVGHGASEAPRGLLYHRYETADDGAIEAARIIPPTSQNQARIEDDLRALGPTLVAMAHEPATHLCEQLIRAYDPCISCATHFLDLRMEGAD